MVVIRCRECDSLVNRHVNSRCPYCTQSLSSILYVTPARSRHDTTDEDGHSIHHSYDPSTTRPSVAVVEAIVDLENGEVAPPDLFEEPLGEYVDCDALNELIASNPDGSVTFPVAEYRVTVDGDEVVVRSTVRDATTRSQ
jgi:hypothetical protein